MRGRREGGSGDIEADFFLTTSHTESTDLITLHNVSGELIILIQQSENAGN